VAVAAATTTRIPAPDRHRRLRFDGVWHDAALLDWAQLPPGWTGPGPAIIAQETATVLVPPGFTAEIGQYGDLILRKAP
jgi:N-methylhydantoinase A